SAKSFIGAPRGVLPFFVICAALLFAWTRRQFGALAALIAVGVFTTTPSVLAFAGLAYSDMTTACMQCAAIFAFVFWLERPSRLSTALLGVAIGMALASKLTSVIFSYIVRSSNRDLSLVSRYPSLEG